MTTNVSAENNTNVLSYHSGGQKSKIGSTEPKLSVSTAAFLLEALGGNPFPSLCQLLEAALMPWLLAT